MTLSQRSLHLALSILVSLIAFKLVATLVLPFTWSQTVRSNQPFHLRVELQLVLFFISCGLVFTSLFWVGYRKTNLIYIQSDPPPALWATLTYLLLISLQILFSINFIYTNLTSSLSFSLPNLTNSKIESILLCLISIYGVLILIGAIWASFRTGNRILHRRENQEEEDERINLEEFEEQDLGERVQIQEHPGRL